MAKSNKTYDVFISCTIDLKAEFNQLKQAFSEAGLSVFDVSELKGGQDIWDALVESFAFVVLLKQGEISANVAVEIGAATAWQKPIYVLCAGQEDFNLPTFINKFHVFKISEIQKVISDILINQKPLTEHEKRFLVEAYKDVGVTLDQLLIQPAYIVKLNKIFQKKCEIKLSGERLVQELLRLRKQGNLARLVRKK